MSTAAIQRAQAAAQVNANATTAQIFGLLTNPTVNVCTLPLVGNTSQKRLRVTAVGYVTTGTTTNVTATLIGIAGQSQPGTPFTIGNWTTIAASTARAVNSASAPWIIEADLIYDNVSGKLHGKFSAEVNNLVDNWAAITGVLTGLSDAPANTMPVALFGVAITFSAANGGNIGNLGDFSLDA